MLRSSPSAAMNPKDWASSPYDKKDWDRYLAFRRSSSYPKCKCRLRGVSGDFWTEDGITILSPSNTLLDLAEKTEDYNHLSYVLMVEHAGVRVLLGGDASHEAWDDILENVGTEGLKADIFFASHHGSPNSINEAVFTHIAPDYVIVSVAEGVDYDRDYYKRLARGHVFSTKHNGTIQLTIQDDGSFLPFIVEHKS